MADEKTADEIAVEKVAADAKAAEDAAGSGDTGGEALKAELEQLRAALKTRNQDVERNRRRLRELEEAETARKQAEMTEADKLKAELEQAKAAVLRAEENVKQTHIRSAFVAEAAKVGAAHPDDVYLLADRSGVDVDEAGKVSGVAEAVKALLDAGRVPLAGRAPAPNLDGGAGGSDRGNGGKVVKLTQEEIDIARRMNMTPEAYAKQKLALSDQEPLELGKRTQ